MRVVEMAGAFDRGAVAGVQVRSFIYIHLHRTSNCLSINNITKLYFDLILMHNTNPKKTNTKQGPWVRAHREPEVLRLALPDTDTDSDATEASSSTASIGIDAVAEWPERGGCKALCRGVFNPTTGELELTVTGPIMEGCPGAHAWLVGCRLQGLLHDGGRELQGTWSVTTRLLRRPPLGLGGMRLDATRLATDSPLVVSEDGKAVARPGGGAGKGGVVTVEVCAVPPVPHGPDDPRYVGGCVPGLFGGWTCLCLCIRF
jgi:hypothetical protein